MILTTEIYTKAIKHVYKVEYSLKVRIIIFHCSILQVLFLSPFSFLDEKLWGGEGWKRDKIINHIPPFYILSIILEWTLSHHYHVFKTTEIQRLKVIKCTFKMKISLLIFAIIILDSVDIYSGKMYILSFPQSILMSIVLGF